MSEARVADTSPLIYLSRAGLLDLLFAGAQAVFAPQAVIDEINLGPPDDPARVTLKSLTALQIFPAVAIPQSVLAWDLGPGESAVLAHALLQPGITAVIDDLAARRCVAALKIPVRGTLGLVLLAKKKGQIPSARQTLSQLQNAGMFLSKNVADAALREVNE